MAGYGMRDGSAIVRAIGDYANYKQRQEQIEYNRDQQAYENQLRERQIAADNHRQNARLSMQMDEADYKASERQRIAKERERSQAAREGFVASNLEGIDAAEKSALDAIKGGASGQGQSVEPVDNGDGTVTVSVRKKDGTVTPFTKNPHDNNSPPFRVRKEDMTNARLHAAKSAQMAEQNGASPEETAAYIRAGFSIDEETGLARPAKGDEFISNLKEQGLSRAMKGEQAAPDSDVPVDVPKGEPEAQAEVKGLVDYAQDAYAAGNRGARQLYNTFIRGDILKQTGVSDSVKKVGNRLLFGTDGATTLDKEGVAKVRPTSKVSTDEGMEDLTKTRKAFDAVGGDKPKPSNKTQQIVEQAPSVEEKTRAVTEKFAKKRERAAAVGELYVTGNINETQMRNFMETGDMRFNKYDIEKHNATAYATRANASTRAAKAQKDLYDAQVEAAKATSEQFEDEQKHQKDITTKLKKTGVAVARVVGHRELGLDPQGIKSLEGEVETLAIRFMGTQRYSKEAMGTPQFAAMWSSGVESYIRENGKSDLSVMSITPYLTTVEGKYKPRSAEVIKAISASYKDRGLDDVRTAHNDALAALKSEVHDRGGVWTDETQEDFYELFKSVGGVWTEETENEFLGQASEGQTTQ